MRITKFNSLLYFSLFLSTFFLNFTPSISELCNPNDKATLLQIKQSFGNPYLLASWTNDSDCCTSWYQVECDRTTHRIVSLTVFAGELPGTIPNAVGNLPYLNHLTFRKLPNLTGPIPVAITKLVNLQFLRLDSNNLSGPVPSFLSRLTNLNLLDLSFNKFSGSIPPSLALLPKLYELYLSRNQLTGPIPKSFGSFKLSNISLDLSHNQLTGPIPTSLGRANSIDFSRNQLSGDASFLFRNKDTWLINLSRNMFEFNMSKVVFGSGLNNVDLNHNKIYGSIPPSLAHLSQIQTFNVSYNRLCGRIPTGGQLGKFDQSSYFHNRCLCGTPLPSCK